MFESNPPHENGTPQRPLALEDAVGAPLPRKGWTRTSWLIILSLVSFMIYWTHFQEGPAKSAQQDHLQEMMFEVQARILVGEAHFVRADAASLYQQAKPLDRGSWEQRLRFVVLAGELAGPDEGLRKSLDLRGSMDRKATGARAAPTQRQRDLAGLLSRLYGAYAAGDYRARSLSPADRALLRAELGWFGELALAPRTDVAPRGLYVAAGAAAALALEQLLADSAEREQVLAPAYETFATAVAILAAVCFAGLVGFVILVIFLVLLAKRQLRGGMATGARHGGVYAETFALFLLAFLGLNILVQLLPWDAPTLVKLNLVPIVSLAVVAWPVLRGIPWARVRQDIGWTLGRKPLLEPGAGLACYVMNLPIVLVGLGLSLVLMAIKTYWEEAAALAQSQPIHPIVDFIAGGSALDRLLVFVAACVVAPIVEETMFRGVLYRHLRELSGGWAWFRSVIFSGTVVSFIFAVIHPQGFVAVPVLMALAYGFTTAREWRGSLVPALVGHAVNNAAVLCVVMVMMGG